MSHMEPFIPEYVALSVKKPVGSFSKKERRRQRIRLLRCIVRERLQGLPLVDAEVIAEVTAKMNEVDFRGRPVFGYLTSYAYQDASRTVEFETREAIRDILDIVLWLATDHLSVNGPKFLDLTSKFVHESVLYEAMMDDSEIDLG